MFEDEYWRRRSILRSLGSGVGLLGIGSLGLSLTSADVADGGTPAVEWHRSYEGGEHEYENRISQFLQTSDGGYALMGEGNPITKTGPEESQLSVIKTNSDGEMQWIAFAGDGREDLRPNAEDFFQTEDGGFVVLASVEWDRTPEEGESAPSAAVAKFSASGDVEWFEMVTKGTWAPARDRTLMHVLPSSANGGFAAFGTWEGEPAEHDGWMVKFTADGTVEWDRTYDSFDGQPNERAIFRYAFMRDDGGYTVIPENFTTDRIFEALHIDENGDIVGSTEFGLDFLSPDHYVRDILPTSDGGFALTGEVRGENWDMWLTTLDENGENRWMQTYDGPYEGDDGADRVIQTIDGGYALGGTMQAAYSGDPRPAIVKTDADGTKEWEKLLERRGGSGLIQTDDHGYALLQAPSTLIKLGPGRDDGTTTETPTETPTEAPDVTITSEPSNAWEKNLDAGTDVTLMANASDSDGSIASIEWDTNGDGEFEQAGETVTVSLDFCGKLPVTVRVTDDSGQSVTDSVTLSTV